MTCQVARLLPATLEATGVRPVPSREHLRRFHFIREIASGGFGSVFLTKVMHADGFSRLVAVKLLKSQWSDSEEVARRMRDEARLLGLLRHRNIVDVIDLTSIDGRAAVIMEYLEAVDFRTVVQELIAHGQWIPVRAGLEMASACASALDAAYNRPPIPGDKPLRVIHRDIKPSNIMVDDTGMVKVLDFGVARSEIENRESHTQELQFGSVDYMAPERLFFEPETPASDVYSLAATLFEVLALEKFGKARGRPARHAAYVADRLSFLRGGLSASGAVAGELEVLIANGLAFNHEERPTAAEFHQRARALARQCDGKDLSDWSETFLPPLVQAAQDAPKIDNPLTDQIMVEDAKVFGNQADQPSGRSAGAADVLRQGALAEMEDTGAFVPSPPTGAPAQLRVRPEIEPDPVDAWDDGPTAVGGLTGPVRVPRPDNAEEARRAIQGRPGQRGSLRPGPELPDPADPFAQLIRSPLSPRPEPPARVAAAAESVPDGPTEVADPLRPVKVPVVRQGGLGGCYNPEAPESSGPIPPLPAPPGVTAQPLQPVLPKPVAALVEPAEEEEVEEGYDDYDDKTVPVIVPPQHRAQQARQRALESKPEAAVPPSLPPLRSGDTIVPFEEEGDEEVTEMVTDSPQVVVPTRLTPVELPEAPTVPVYGPTSATLGAPYGASPSATPSSTPVSSPVASVSPTPVPSPVASPPSIPSAPVAGSPEPPSLDDVVPQSDDSRYAIEIAAAESAAAEATEPSIVPQSAVVAPVEALVEPDSSMEPHESAPYLDVVPDTDEPDDIAPAPKKSKAPLFAAAGCFFLLVLGGGGFAVAWTFGLGEKLAAMGADSVDVPVVEDVTDGSGAADLAGAADTGSADVEDGPEAPAVEDGMVRFRVGIDGVRKLKVDCGGVKATGDVEVTVEHGFEGDCSVTAILADRSRKTTRVPAPDAGSYLCFADGGDACEAE